MMRSVRWFSFKLVIPPEKVTYACSMADIFVRPKSSSAVVNTKLPYCPALFGRLYFNFHLYNLFLWRSVVVYWAISVRSAPPWFVFLSLAIFMWICFFCLLLFVDSQNRFSSQMRFGLLECPCLLRDPTTGLSWVLSVLNQFSRKIYLLLHYV